MLDGNLYGSPVALTGVTTNIPLLTNTLQSGPHVLRVFYSGDSAHQANTSASATLTVLEPVGVFTLSPSASSTTALPGESSNPVTLTATPAGGFNSTISFACTGGLPSGAVCNFAPSILTPNGPAPKTTVLTISPAGSVLRGAAAETARTSEPPASPLHRDLSRGISATMAGLLLFILPRRTRRWSVLCLLLALSSLGVLSGCGSGGVDPNASGPGTLSAGSYAVTVTATGGSTIQTATVTLTIQ
jgi:hypothetical protein